MTMVIESSTCTRVIISQLSCQFILIFTLQWDLFSCVVNQWELFCPFDVFLNCPLVVMPTTSLDLEWFCQFVVL